MSPYVPKAITQLIFEIVYKGKVEFKFDIFLLQFP